MRDLMQDWRFLTSPLRMLPDFIIPGEAKCGTTSLYHYLAQHPSVLRADVKEPGNFWKYGGSSLLCRVHYPLAVRRAAAAVAGGRVITGEASAEYLSKVGVPENVKAVVPAVKLIVLLRNPVSRAYSDYQMLARAGRAKEPFATIARRTVAWIRDEETRPLVDAAAQQEWNNVRFVHRGIYAWNVRRWFACFRREQFLFLKSEDLFSDPHGVTARALRFLGLEAHAPADVAPRKQGGYSEGLDAATRDMLSEFYAPYNAELERLTGERFDWQQGTHG